MSMTDPIADLLTRLRNAIVVKHDRVEVPASKAKLALCQILEREGYIKNFSVTDRPPGRVIHILLRYNAEGVPAITRVTRVSKPGRRVYKRTEEILPVLNGLGVSVISTSQGLLTDSQARERRVGGEILCEVY